jgi:hypothetical protein
LKWPRLCLRLNFQFFDESLKNPRPDAKLNNKMISGRLFERRRTSAHSTSPTFVSADFESKMIGGRKSIKLFKFINFLFSNLQSFCKSLN